MNKKKYYRFVFDLLQSRNCVDWPYGWHSTINRAKRAAISQKKIRINELAKEIKNIKKIKHEEEK